MNIVSIEITRETPLDLSNILSQIADLQKNTNRNINQPNKLTFSSFDGHKPYVNNVKKARLETPQNGQFNDYNYFRSQFVESTEKNRPLTEPTTEEEYSGEFQCTFSNCGKRLNSNMGFMYHVWAHVVQMKPADETVEDSNLQFVEDQHNCHKNGYEHRDETERSDVDRLQTCPECLIVQPSPYRVQLHYHRAHKRDKQLSMHNLVTCNICEQVIDGDKFGAHMATHFINRTIDLPYSCRYIINGKKCRFRVSTRVAMFEHFMMRHFGTFTVLCPFCLMTFSVPAVERKTAAVVQMKDYIRHMVAHDMEKSAFCAQCATRFPQSAKVQLAQHQQQHIMGSQSDDRKWVEWKQTRRELDSIQVPKSNVHINEVILKECIECGNDIANLWEHFAVQQPILCSNCAYSTHCKRAMQRHSLTSECGGKASKWPSKDEDGPAELTHMQRPEFSCTISHHFKTKSVQAMFEHQLQNADCFSAQMVIVRRTENDLPTDEEQKIADLFGITRLAGSYWISDNQRGAAVESNDDDCGEDNSAVQLGSDDERRRQMLVEFLPPIRVRELANNERFLKHLLGEHNAEKSKEALNIFEKALRSGKVKTTT